ncbi:uncharacterized protein PHACADRAFT_248156 [Phanerochaete carnosa HHB-10118-sp]|uniref:DUF4246 domain-containing protein n=1 Tax=Phanerochaete carnosa (strain HHB-10118-sp) TaxID=650164 RepID=K5WQH6_PHACS|nr:uncharacterized protein PHACADRAFT_248156 [Phanerochaete carnosa HHB-10118-sp]EKM61499.1 hypothetical protein PHACADRAFT_248156 [Phanerochaete carnosa HHB-10118-sp]
MAMNTAPPDALETSKLNRGYLHPFWNGGSGRYLYGVGELPRTLTELAMCQLSATTRRSDGWWTKLSDPVWRCSWRNTALSSSFCVRTSTGNTVVFLSQKQVQYVLDELSGYLALKNQDANCEVSCYDRIWETSTPNDPCLLHILQEQLNTLRTVSSLGTSCRNIINPYLHPVVYGRTLVRDLSGTLVPAEPPPFSQLNYTISSRFACLPTLFAVSPCPSAGPPMVTTLSYINGVPPWQDGLYRSLEGALAASVPLFEHVLTDLHRSNLLSHRIPGTCRYTAWDEPLTPEHSDDEESWAVYQKELRSWTLSRPIQYPDVLEQGYMGGMEERKFRASLRGRNIKVIIRVTDIQVHPDHPAFDGTPWHAEGMRNERIVASVVQCIAMSNVKPISLSFRMPVRAPVGCSSDDEGATIRTWGLRLNSSSHQFLGTTSLRAGHALAFPNIYQHRFTDVRLEDTARPGALTLLSLHLVDPELTGGGGDDDASDLEVPATNRVPAQQTAWVRAALEESIDTRVPEEIIERIMDFVEGVLTDDEAAASAHAMKHERVQFWKEHNQLWFSLPFAGFEN